MRHETYHFFFGFGIVADEPDQWVQSKFGHRHVGVDELSFDQRHDQRADALSVVTRF
jgi:hypothetical protein